MGRVVSGHRNNVCVCCLDLGMEGGGIYTEQGKIVASQAPTPAAAHTRAKVNEVKVSCEGTH